MYGTIGVERIQSYRVAGRSTLRRGSTEIYLPTYNFAARAVILNRELYYFREAANGRPLYLSENTYFFSQRARAEEWEGAAWFRGPVSRPWGGTGTNRLTDVLAANWPRRSDLVISLSTSRRVAPLAIAPWKREIKVPPEVLYQKVVRAPRWMSFRRFGILSRRDIMIRWVCAASQPIFFSPQSVARSRAL